MLLKMSQASLATNPVKSGRHRSGDVLDSANVQMYG